MSVDLHASFGFTTTYGVTLKFHPNGYKNRGVELGVVFFSIVDEALGIFEDDVGRSGISWSIGGKF